jgi:hypothetical protein
VFCWLLPVHAAFEITGEGARSTALAGAFTAMSADPESVWFNPAGSARVQKKGVGTTHAVLYPGLEESPSLNALAANFPLRGGGAQVGLSVLGFENWSEQVLVAGYGRPLHARVAVGASIASRGWQVGRLSRRTWGLDLGGVYEVGWVLPRAYMRLALVLKNLNRPNVSAAGHRAGRIPVGIVAGALIEDAHQRILLDLARERDYTRLRIGYETRPDGWGGLKFRLGADALFDPWENREMNAGLGHNWQQWHFDYAYSYPLRLEGLGGIHRVSIRWVQ